MTTNKLWPGYNPSLRPSIDHIRSRRDGGMDRLGNIALAHRDCNHKKGARFPYPCELLYGRIIKMIIQRARA